METRSEVAIVGAGIAGTVLAIACNQAGLPVRLYEREADCVAVDAMLEITPNGSRVLHALGLKSALAEAALLPAFTTVRSARTAFLLSQRALGAFSEARYGAPTYLIGVSELKALLWQACRDADISMNLGASIVDIDTATGTLITNDGTRHPHLAVAVASGQPEENGLSQLLESRILKPNRQLTLILAHGRRPKPQRDHDRFINTWLFPAGYCIERPLPTRDDQSQQVELFAVVAAPTPDTSPGAALRGLLHRSHPALESLTHDLEAVYLPDLSTSAAEHWHAGRCALLGDICHAPPGHSNYGPAAAMEDAWVLSRMMERWEEEPHQDFATFEKFRKSRARRLRTHAAAELQSLTLERSAEIWRRNLAWSLTSRFLPEITMEKLDWLYGYDCIKGFA